MTTPGSPLGPFVASVNWGSIASVHRARRAVQRGRRRRGAREQGELQLHTTTAFASL